MYDIKDKIVLITGGAAGIGARVVNILLEENCKHITILDIDDKNGFAVQNELCKKYGTNKVKFIKCDVTREDELLNAFGTVKNEQGYIDVVINNAGIGNDKTFVKEIDVNFTALVRGTLQAWELMRKDEGGRGGTVINISSVTALASFPAVPIYSATKAAVLKFSTTIGAAVHYSRTNVRVLTICFGVTLTQMLLKENMGTFDPSVEDMVHADFAPLKSQTAEEAARGVKEVYKNGKTGSVWVVTSAKPAIDVTEKFIQNIENFNDIVFD